MSPSASDLARFRPYLQFLARLTWNRSLQSKVDPSDIVQQTMLRAHEQSAQFKGNNDAELAAWLRQILVNVFLQEQRYYFQARRDVDLERSLHAQLADSSQQLCRLADGIASPESAAVFHERMLAVSSAVEGLPAQQRDAIILHYWQGLSIREVAVQLDKSPTAIGGLIHRGLKGLRAALADSV